MNSKTKFALRVYLAALRLYKRGGLHPLFVTGQAVYESGWGRHAIGNNIFGIKWTKGPYHIRTTTEYYNSRPSGPHVISCTPYSGKFKCKIQAKFQSYPSIQDSILGHTKLLMTPRYRSLWRFRHDPVSLARKVREAGYATSLRYVSTLVSVMRSVLKRLRPLQKP